MPYVLTFNKEFISEKIISICDYLDLDKSFESFMNWIMLLREEFNIPHKLSDIIDPKKIDDQNHTVDLSIDIDKGKKVYVGEINMLGNIQTKDNLVEFS